MSVRIFREVDGEQVEVTKDDMVADALRVAVAELVQVSERQMAELEAQRQTVARLADVLAQGLNVTLAAEAIDVPVEVHVPPLEVTVPPAEVTVEVPERRKVSLRVERDADGEMVRVVEE